MRSIWTPFLIVALIYPNCFAESESGSLCIAPARFDPKNASAPGLYCEAEQFSLKIDGQVMAWPVKESLKLAGLGLNSPHSDQSVLSPTTTNFHFSLFTI